ncbi:MAG TPA: NAD-dependent epimerase/dehydratase family protein [Acidimicrobiales bacterium]|nr:NAD-dependent epimerase/dehydratase family protein [Acidimicrobiales bacterium]
MRLKRGDRVLVTGAAGFIGSAITRALLDRHAAVVALVEPGSDDASLDGLDVERREGDIRSSRDVAAAADGTRCILHTAALFAFWSRDPDAFYDVNVLGTRNVIAAGLAAGCERIVYTSTVATIGLEGTAAGRPADESVHARFEDLHGHYKQTKYVAEHEVLRAAAQGAPVTLVHPTFPLGPRDRRPTPTGKVVLDFLNGRMPGYVDTAMNVEHVDDLANGHLLALERGVIGRSYILGGENVTMQRLLGQLADCTGLPRVDRHFPRRLGLVAGVVSHLLEARLLGREPHVPLEAAQMSMTKMIFDDSRARRELGYSSRPTSEAIESSARWFADNGYVRPERLARITWPQSA